MLAAVSVAFLGLPASAFEPTTEAGHAGIVRDALELVEHALPDGTVLRFSERAIREIADAAAAPDDPLGPDGESAVPGAHCDDERIAECSQRVVDLLAAVVDSLENDAARDGFRARSDLGRALHTAQAFYAASNWVDIPGPGNDTLHPDLGETVIPSLGPGETACVDDGVGDTLAGAGLTGLTSGYLSTVAPPFGKCAHGEPDGPGIHKDGPTRPRHSTARSLAVLQTLDLVDRVLAAVGDDAAAVRALLRAPGTLGFVVDRSGSMGEEIAGVLEAINGIVAASAAGTSVPGEYLLQLFADPDLSAPFVTSDPAALEAAVGAVELTSGGDCPEPSLGAVLAAVGRAAPNSRLFVFTDASAKDDALAAGVADAAAARRIRLDFVLTDRCGGEDFDPVFARLARATGGSVLLIGEDEVSELFALIEPGLSGDLEPLLIVDTQLDDEQRSWDVPVDSTLDTVTFAASLEVPADVVVRRPSGVPVGLSDADADVTELSTGRIVTIDSPEPGPWTFEVAGDGLLWASVVGAGSLGLVDFRFVETRGRLHHLGSFPLPGSPAQDQPSEYLATLAGDVTAVSLAAVAPDGTGLAVLPSSPLGTADQQTGSATPPSGEFRVAVSGQDAAGFPFQRAFAPMFRAQPVRVDPPVGGLLLGEVASISAVFRVENLGPPDTFALIAADQQGLVVDVTPAQLTLGTGQSSSATVELGGAGQPGPDLLSLVAQSTSDEDVRNGARTLVTVEGGAGCSPAPRTGCLAPVQPGKARLSLTSGSGKLSWKWKKGAATGAELLGDPVSGTAYGLCLYDTVGGLPVRVLDERIPSGAAWKATKRGFKYKAPKGTEGLTKVVVSAGSDGKASAQVKGKRVRLPALPVAQSDAFVVQLVNDAGGCWAASYLPAASKNTAKKLSAKGE